MKKIITLLLIPFFASALVACGDDNDDANIVGPSPTQQTTGALNFSQWNTVTAMVDCDFPAINAGTAVPDRAHDLMLVGNGGTITSGATDPANDADTGGANNNTDANANAGALQALQCTGGQATTITVLRNGQFTLASGRVGNLSTEERDRLTATLDGFSASSVNLANIQCEDATSVQHNELVWLAGADFQKTYIYSSDDQSDRQCFLGDRARALALQQALQDIWMSHGTVRLN